MLVLLVKATEPIVDLALAARKPFAAVPCCVFPSQNQHRKTPEGKVVTTLDEFVAFLLKKNPDATFRSLLDNVPGCNKIVWSPGPHKIGPRTTKPATGANNVFTQQNSAQV